jgi:hypothetical protein
MQMNSSALRVTWRRVLTLAFGIAGATHLVMAQTRTVTIDVMTSPISYLDPQQPGSAYRLCVAKGESVLWQAVTAKPNNGRYSAMVFFPNGTPFADTAGRPITRIVWSERTSTDRQAAVVEKSGSYEYYVAVYDEDHQKTYADDPKIIVGSGGVDAEINTAIENLKQASAQLSRDPQLQGKADQIEAIQKELQHILAELKK